MIQSKRNSLIESVTNTAVGYLVACASQAAIFPLFGVHVPISTNLKMGLWFTVISIVRSYLLRRWFTRRTEALDTKSPA